MQNRQALFIRLVRNLESITMLAIDEEWNAENKLSFVLFCFWFLFLSLLSLLFFDRVGESKVFKKRKHIKTSQTVDNWTRITQKSADIFIYISLTHVLRLQSLNLRFHQSGSMQLSTHCSKRQPHPSGIVIGQPVYFQTYQTFLRDASFIRFLIL